jgi:hypothetical protein
MIRRDSYIRTRKKSWKCIVVLQDSSVILLMNIFQIIELKAILIICSV